MAKKFVLPKKRYTEFRRDLLLGCSHAHLSKKYGFAANPRAVARLAKLVGLTDYVGSGKSAAWGPQMRAWWEGGMPLAEIAARTHLSIYQARERVRQLGLELRDIDYAAGMKWDAARVAAFEADWQADVPVETLASKYGRTVEQLQQYRRRLGWAPRLIDNPQALRWTPEEDAEIARLHALGASAQAMAHAPKLQHRTKMAIDARIHNPGLKRSWKKGRALPETVAPQVAKFLEGQDGPVSFERIRHHLNIRNADLLRAALKQLRRANTITSPARGAYALNR